MRKRGIALTVVTAATLLTGVALTSGSDPVPVRAEGAGTQAAPALSRWPNASNTGVPRGVKLRRSGSLVIRRPGTVIDAYDIHGCVKILASNVRITRTRIRGICPTGLVNTGYDSKYTNIVLSRVELDGMGDLRTFLIGHTGWTIRRGNLHGGFSQAHPRSNTKLIDSYIHHPASGQGRHVSGVGFHGGTNFVMRHNRVECLADGCSAALSLYGNFEQVRNVLIEDNYFSGGAYCTYAGSLPKKPFPLAKNTRYLRNAFARTGRGPFPKCGRHGPVASFDPRNGNRWAGNYYLDGHHTPVPYDPHVPPTSG